MVETVGVVSAPSVVDTEEKTEPFSQTEIEARLLASRRQGEVGAQATSTLLLDRLVVPTDGGIRILVRPTRGRSIITNAQNCEWVDLQPELAEQNQPAQHRVLAVRQTPQDIKFVVRVRGDASSAFSSASSASSSSSSSASSPDHVLSPSPLPLVWYDLYFDPASDDQILNNRSDVPIVLSRLSADPETNADAGFRFTINPRQNSRALAPGSWRISIDGDPVVDFRVLAKPPAKLWAASDPAGENAEVVGGGGRVSAARKRLRAADDCGDVHGSDDDSGGGGGGGRGGDGDGGGDGGHGDGDGDGDGDHVRPAAGDRVEGERTGAGKRMRIANEPAADKDDGVEMVLRPEAELLAFPLDVPAPRRGRELATTEGHPLLILQQDQTVEIGGETDGYYTITKRGESIASTALSTVYTADHSNLPGRVVVCKVLKTRSPATVPAHDMERNVIRQAEMWLRESQCQEDLRHERIVRLYGGDARYLSLYMEHVDARDLSVRAIWRHPSSDMFTGTRSDALRILRDIAGALHYLHGRGLVHNDIKPSNILYSRPRGAVLCDMGMSTRVNGPPCNGGTPYYLPPEFIALKQRGRPSDIWALGTTMMFVLGKIQYPDARGARNHPRHLHWMINQVNAPPASNNGPNNGAPSAAMQMRKWLLELREARARLNVQSKLERLVSHMFIAQPAQRITVEGLVSELFGEQHSER